MGVDAIAAYVHRSEVERGTESDDMMATVPRSAENRARWLELAEVGSGDGVGG
jgi:hypothetical protein